MLKALRSEQVVGVARGATNHVIALAGSAAALCAAIASAGGPAYEIALVDNPADHGLEFLHQPEESVYGVEYWINAGGAVADFNNDGYPDIFVLGGGGTPDSLFINNGDGTFTDQAEAWGVAVEHCGVGAAAADYTGNGYPDIYVTSLGSPDFGGQPGQNRLYHNNGDGTFTEVAEEAGVNVVSSDMPNANGASWGDYTLDGHLDLFVACWHGPSQCNRLFRNNGDGTFTDVTEQAGILAVDEMWGFQGRFTDMNGNGWPDLLVAADFNSSRYFRNNGDGTFTDITEPSGTGQDAFGMGSAVADFNNNGLLDWYVSSIYVDQDPPPPWNVGNMLYLNQGDHAYDEVSEELGVNDGGWGWGAAPADLNNDGRTDLIAANGRPDTMWADDTTRIFRSNVDGTFTDVAGELGLVPTEGRGVVTFDADRDGRLDVVTFNNSQPMSFYRNESDAGTWLSVRLDTSNNPLLAPDGFGARVIVTADGESFQRYIDGAPSFLATSEPVAHFGLGDAQRIEELRIEWPRGYVTSLSNVAINEHHIVQGPDLTDLTADGTVGTDDLSELIDRWGPVDNADDLLADLDNDGTVDGTDLGMLLSEWSR